MNSFKTLEELNEYKKQSFEQVFGKVKIQRPESPFKKGTFEDLQFNARPHEVFNLDWSSYDSEDFGNRFLPYVKDFVTAKGKATYDGANLLKGIPKSERKLFLFDDHKYLIFLVNYTYPKGVLAEQRKNRALATEDEVLTFIELEKDDTIDIHFKFGRRFKEYLTEAIKQSGTSKSISSLEEKVYKTDAKKFKSFFKNGMVHDTMMRYILGILGIEKETVAFSEYNALFTKKVISFMDDFTIAGKYKPYVFIEKTQRAVQLKTDPTVDGGTKIKPNANEIYIWLVHKDSSFIKVQLGTNVAKDLKEKEITQDAIEHIIINEIKAELDTNIYSNKTIDRATHKGLGDALIQLWILDRKESSELNTEIFNTNPALFLALQATSFTMEKIESYKFKEHHWNPKLENYLPFIEGDTLFNAQVCGFVNGIIDQVKAIPEMLAFFSKILGSEKEKEAFIKGLKKIFEEGIVQVIIESATKEYKKAIQEGGVERLYYNLAHDVIQIVSLLIGVFQLAKGVASFVNFTKKGLKYIRYYSRKGIDDLKKLNSKQIKEVFDELDDNIKFKENLSDYEKTDLLGVVTKKHKDLTYRVLLYSDGVLFKVDNPDFIWKNKARIYGGELTFDFNTYGVKGLGQKWTNDVFEMFENRVKTVKTVWTENPAYPEGRSLGHKQFWEAYEESYDKIEAVKNTTFYKTMNKRGFSEVETAFPDYEKTIVILKK